MLTPASSGQRWDDQSLRILLGLYYWLPLASGDDSNETNRVVARCLNRKRSSIDRQWRNVKDWVRGAGNVKGPTRTFAPIFEEVRDVPALAVAYGRDLAQTCHSDLANCFPRPGELDFSDFREEAFTPEPDVIDLLMLRLTWTRPDLALRAPTDATAEKSWTWIGQQCQRRPEEMRNRARLAYAAANRVCLDHVPVAEMRKRLLKFIEGDPLVLQTSAQDLALAQNWHIWTYLKS